MDTTGLGYCDTALDIAVGVRAEIVRDQAEHLLPARTLLEIYQRFAIYRNLESMNETIEAALFRDIARACGCSPTTVGKIRKAVGQLASVRSVQRMGTSYQMNLNFSAAA